MPMQYAGQCARANSKDPQIRSFEDDAERQLVDRIKQASVEEEALRQSQVQTHRTDRSNSKRKCPRSAKRHANANISMIPYVVPVLDRDRAEEKSFLTS